MTEKIMSVMLGGTEWLVEYVKNSIYREKVRY